MPELFLKPKEIHKLTGYSQQSKQFVWLSQNGFFAKH